MADLIRAARLIKARKQFDCMASEWLVNSLDNRWALDGYTFAEKRSIVHAKRNKWKIMPGEIYHNSVMKQDGEVYTFRAIPAIHKICQDHDIYQDC